MKHALISALTAALVVAGFQVLRSAEASRNSSGTMSLATPGVPFQSNQTISSTQVNNTLSDISTEITNSLERNGKGGMLAALRGIDGTVAAPAYSWTSDTGTGEYRIGSGDLGWSISGTKKLELTASTLSITPDLAVNTNKFNVTASSGNTTVAGTLGVTSDVAINTNKFTVTASSGNTAVAGTLGVTGATTATGGITVGASGAAMANAGMFTCSTIAGTSCTATVPSGAKCVCNFVGITPPSCLPSVTTTTLTCTASSGSGTWTCWAFCAN